MKGQLDVETPAEYKALVALIKQTAKTGLVA